jgi:hypothetical protein
LAAESAGIISVSREGPQLVLRFVEEWSRAAVLRALAPNAPNDRIPGVPIGGIVGGSNQVRLQMPTGGPEAWATTRAVIERLADRLPRLLSGAA